MKFKKIEVKVNIYISSDRSTSIKIDGFTVYLIICFQETGQRFFQFNFCQT